MVAKIFLSCKTFFWKNKIDNENIDSHTEDDAQSPRTQQTHRQTD